MALMVSDADRGIDALTVVWQSIGPETGVHFLVPANGGAGHSDKEGSMGAKRTRRLLLGLTAAAMAFAAGGTAATGAAAGTGPSVELLKLEPLGSVTVSSLPVRRGLGHRQTPVLGPDLEGLIERLKSGEGASQLAPVQVPTPPHRPIVVQESPLGWEGITHLDQRLSDNGNQFSAEPPDQALCVGNGFVVEGVNNALNIYDTHGVQLLAGAVSYSQFFGLPPGINRTTGKFGPFLSDPKCYFDPDTQRWFQTELMISLDPNTGAFKAPAFTLIAVSKTADPTGAYFRYRLPATEFGKRNCPCFGDQPLIGADRYGFYVNTSEYPIGTGHANFAQLYAMDKHALENGSAFRAVHFSDLGTGTASIQPATSPGGVYAGAANGTEFLMSGFDCAKPDCNIKPGLDNRVTVWALTNTKSLQNATPSLHLSSQTLHGITFENPEPQFQRPGPLVLGADPTENPDRKVSRVESNDARMNQVVYAAGKLFGAINTAVGPGVHTGIGWYVLQPSISGGSVHASIHRQGYVSTPGQNVSFPAVAVNTHGKGVMAFSLIGTPFFPSAAYVRMGTDGVSGPIVVARRGAKPEDGFSCYEDPATGQPSPDAVCRWGDYSAAVPDENGTIWSATEFIGDNPRTAFANWSTFVWPTRP
jgi:hypothetical protein